MPYAEQRDVSDGEGRAGDEVAGGEENVELAVEGLGGAQPELQLHIGGVSVVGLVATDLG